jgi:hypothetical protein
VLDEPLRTCDEGHRHPEGFREPTDVDHAALPYPEVTRGATSPVAKRHHRARLLAQHADPVGVVDVDGCSIPLGERGEGTQRSHSPSERIDSVTNDDVIPHSHMGAEQPLQCHSVVVRESDQTIAAARGHEGPVEADWIGTLVDEQHAGLSGKQG